VSEGNLNALNALTTAKKIGIAVDDIFRNSRPANIGAGEWSLASKTKG
jgi:ribosomal protein L13E